MNQNYSLLEMTEYIFFNVLKKKNLLQYIQRGNHSHDMYWPLLVFLPLHLLNIWDLNNTSVGTKYNIFNKL